MYHDGEVRLLLEESAGLRLPLAAGFVRLFSRTILAKLGLIHQFLQ